ncbi:ubiquitin carboxyl-terminal hydrolase 3 [Physcomitrium patens]|uniref:Ubiquitin carboxyl-terminal hydrolase n=3 Tax=Physcomitrium patens TaxID=3218 RepID=A0A2K1KTQ9_PHYPA|nr:ubiquitin carboxyl-terminal hydrolase 3-like [Physcomitrium patens]PNR57148.1 hypothetical protein PHYPA_004141 [Physcomitrium patens]|eukprot:XP_024369743.1 ubiquitin carboxyl-terminal hydrolase 3-like [Physcomitrella patens]
MGDVGKKRWLPLEANPDVMNQFLHGLGFPSDVGCHDVFGFDDDLLAMVPTPVLAVLLLFPITKESEEASLVEQTKIAEAGQQVSENVYFMKQTVGNACGTIGLLHAVGNVAAQVDLAEDSYLQRFVKKTSVMSPDEKAHFLETDTELETAHSVAACGGDTAPPDISSSVDLHFICFVCVDGGLYELDGRKKQPIYHGPSSQETLLKDSVNVVQEFMARNPESMNFNVIALAKES